MNESKLEVIRKLLAKAEGAATEHEAEAFNAKATELMARYGIDDAILAATGEVKDEITSRKVNITGAYSTGKARLVGWIVKAMGGRAVLHNNRGGKTTSAVTIFGFASDLERAELLFTSLLLQAEGQVRHARPEDMGRWTEGVTAFRRAWFHGFASTVSTRIEQAEARAKEAAATEQVQTSSGSTGMELVLARRQDQVTLAYKQAFPRLGKAKRTRVSSLSGYEQGIVAGERADIGQRRVGGNRRALQG